MFFILCAVGCNEAASPLSDFSNPKIEGLSPGQNSAGPTHPPSGDDSDFSAMVLPSVKPPRIGRVLPPLLRSIAHNGSPLGLNDASTTVTPQTPNTPGTLSSRSALSSMLPNLPGRGSWDELSASPIEGPKAWEYYRKRFIEAQVRHFRLGLARAIQSGGVKINDAIKKQIDDFAKRHYSTPACSELQNLLNGSLNRDDLLKKLRPGKIYQCDGVPAIYNPSEEVRSFLRTVLTEQIRKAAAEASEKLSLLLPK